MERRFNLVNYVEDISKRLKRVKHSNDCIRFFTVSNLGDLDGLLDNIYSSSPPYVVVVDAENESNKTETVSSLFNTVLVLASTKIEAKLIMRSIKSKMLFDREKTECGLDAIAIDSITDVEFGPLRELKGRMLSFYIDDCNDLDYDIEEWDSI